MSIWQRFKRWRRGLQQKNKYTYISGELPELDWTNAYTQENLKPAETRPDSLSVSLPRDHGDELYQWWLLLSPREQDVTALTCLRYTDSQIAARLGLSKTTVRTYIEKVLHKLALQSKADLRVIFASWISAHGSAGDPSARFIALSVAIFASPRRIPFWIFPSKGVFLFSDMNYCRRMDKLLDLRPKQWNLIVLPRRNTPQLLAAMAWLAEKIDLIVLDCGRQYDSSIVARAARGRREVVDRIRVQRAFICSEVVKLVQQTPAGNAPVIVLDFLSTFYDENVKMHTRKFLLERSLLHFQRLSHGAGLAVMVHPPPASPDSLWLFQRLQSSASRLVTYETHSPGSQQWRLF